MSAYKSISVLVLIIGFAHPGAAMDSVAITVAEVANTIAAAGMDVSPNQVTLLSNAVAKMQNPALRVESIERWGDHRMKVRMDCISPDDCIPFFVAVRLSHDLPGIEPPAVRPGNRLGQVACSADAPAPCAVRAGSSAILLLEGQHIHIQLPVICLENGRVGQTIRATSKDRRQTYSAEVVNTRELRGRVQ
jgi:hypothetical protein